MPVQVLPSFATIQEYDEMRSRLDVEAFGAAAFQIARRHHLPEEALKLYPDGSNVIFSHGTQRVIKIFPEVLQSTFESERLVLSFLSPEHLRQKLSVPIPTLEHYGEFEGWPYLIMTRVEGETLEAVWGSLDFGNKVTLIREIGLLIREVHSLGVQGLESIDSHWSQFIERQHSLCSERHRNHHLKAEILAGLPDYLAKARKLLPQSFKTVLLTGEYTPFNLLVKKDSNRWTLSGMIDFGDCMLGYPEYDLLGPGAFLVQGDKRLLKELLISYGYSETELTSDLSCRLTALMLLHRFSNLKIQLRIPEWEKKVHCVEDLESLAWGLK